MTMSVQTRSGALEAHGAPLQRRWQAHRRIKRRRWATVLALAVLAVAGALCDLFTGPAAMPPAQVLLGLIDPDRSEEHTSELQSRENLVCRLLLEKKKT